MLKATQVCGTHPLVARPPAAASGVGCACGQTIGYVQCQYLKYNAIIIGWMGVIMASVMIFGSLMSLQLQANIGQLLQQLLLGYATEKEQQFVMNLLAAFSTIAYGFSLINLGVSLLLLIGVAKDSSGLLYPWLIYHGVIFGIGLYVGLFNAMTSLYMDLSSFLMCLLVCAQILVIYYKIYQDIFTLFRILQQQQQQQQHQRGAIYRAAAAADQHLYM